MLLSALIKQLQDIHAEHGDLPVKKRSVHIEEEELTFDDFEGINSKVEAIVPSGIAAYNDKGNCDNPTHVYIHN